MDVCEVRRLELADNGSVQMRAARQTAETLPKLRAPLRANHQRCDCGYVFHSEFRRVQRRPKPCPNCGLRCAPIAERCDCGYVFPHPDRNLELRSGPQAPRADPVGNFVVWAFFIGMGLAASYFASWLLALFGVH